MKRGHFILLFALITLLVFYSESHQPNLTHFGCTTSPNKITDPTNPQVPEESCYLSDNPDAVLGYKKIPAEFTYQGYKPDFEFEVTGNSNPKIYGPKIILGKIKRVPYSAFKQPPSTSSCGYYTFFYQRQESSSTFNTPFSSYEQISPTERLCHFSITPEMLSFITEQTLGLNLQNLRTILPEELTAYEGTSSNDEETTQSALTFEEIKSFGDCTPGFEQKAEFTDSQGNTFKHCIKTETFQAGNIYITDSYIQADPGTNEICQRGEGYTKEGQEFTGQNGNSYYLCVSKQQIQSQSDSIHETSISTEECPSDFNSLQEPINLTENLTLRHCIKRENIQQSINSRKARTISSPASGFISVCSEIQGRDITDLDICKQGGTYPCEVKVSEGPSELYAFTYERDPCGNIIIKEDNNGLSLTGEDYFARAQAFVAECSQRQEDAIPEEEPEILCGNSNIDEGEECDDGNIENGDGCNQNCEKEEDASECILPENADPRTLRGNTADCVTKEACEEFKSSLVDNPEFGKKLAPHSTLEWEVFGESTLAGVQLGWGVSQVESRAFLDSEGKKYAKVAIGVKAAGGAASNDAILGKGAESLSKKWWELDCIDKENYKSWGRPKMGKFTDELAEAFSTALEKSQSGSSIALLISENKIVVKQGSGSGDYIINSKCGDKLFSASGNELEADGKSILYVKYTDELTGKVIQEERISQQERSQKNLKSSFDDAFQKVQGKIDELKACLKIN